MRNKVLSEVAGILRQVTLQVGATVDKGDALMILEAMKMEAPIEATVEGKLVEICVSEEDQVEEDQVLAIVETGMAASDRPPVLASA